MSRKTEYSKQLWGYRNRKPCSNNTGDGDIAYELCKIGFFRMLIAHLSGGHSVKQTPDDISKSVDLFCSESQRRYRHFLPPGKNERITCRGCGTKIYLQTQKT